MYYLCFVHIVDDGVLQNQSLTFTHRYNFDYDEYERKLTISENTDIPKDFWGRHIYSLTALVGENGAGKTTAIRNIMRKVGDGYNLPANEDVIIYEDTTNNKFVVCCSDDLNIINKTKQEYTVDRRKTEKISIFFYSSHLSVVNSYFDNPLTGQMQGIYNGSNNYRLWFDIQNYQNEDNFHLRQTANDCLFAFMAERSHRIANLLANNYKQMEDYGLRPPKLIGMVPNRTGFIAFHKKYEDSTTTGHPYYKSKNQSDICNSLWLIAYNSLFNAAMNEGFATEEYIDAIDAIGKEIKEKKITATELIERIRYVLIVQNLHGFADVLCNVLTQIEDICSYNNRNGYFYVDIADKANCSKLLELLNYIRQNSRFVTARFFDLQFSHTDSFDTLLSSGEQEMLDLFSNIYASQITVPEKATNIKPKQLLVLDEAEVGNHPEWQRKFVSNLISFLQVLYEKVGHQFQVIVTSHSPIILSDIPRCCTNYLSRNPQVNEHRETFAANIFDLYRDSFFLQNGLIGEFAMSKLRRIEKNIEQMSKDEARNMSVEELLQEINLIGDKHIQRIFRENVERLDDSRARRELISYYEEKLNKLRSML